MARTDPARSVRIGAEWATGEQLARRLSEITGQPLSMTEYVREALREHNRRMQRVVDAPEIAAGDVVIHADGVDVGGVTLVGPGAWRIAGTTDLIEIRPTVRQPRLDVVGVDDVDVEHWEHETD